MRQRKEIVLRVISALLIGLFVYTAVSKLLDWPTYEYQMLSQPLPDMVNRALVWSLPVVELVTAGCLAIKRFWRIGFVLSFGLMLAFTLYVALALLNVFGEVPCSCGGVLQRLGWEEHLVFNIVFLVLAGVGATVAGKRWLVTRYLMDGVGSPKTEGRRRKVERR